MLRDLLAKDHLDLLQESHDSSVDMVAGLEERRRRGDETVFARRRHAADVISLVSAKYSLGRGYDEMRQTAQPIPQILLSTQDRLFDPTDSGDSIFVLLNAAALVALFEDGAGARQLIEVVNRFGVKDFLIDSYIGSMTAFREPSPQLQMAEICIARRVKTPPLYDGQKEAAELAAGGEDEAAARRLETYVSVEWYRSHASDFNWNPPAQARRFYAGHWCFTGAATAKVFGIEDSALRGHERYPWDLIHPAD